MKILRKKWVKTIIIVLGVVMAVYLAVVVKLVWNSHQRQAAIDRFQESIEKPFKEDTYGGKTPEETWTMFLDALKKEDFALASKYYDVEHQTEARKWLEGLKQKNELNQTIKEMETLRKSNNQPLSGGEKKVYYSYDFFSKKYNQELTSRIIFYLNPYTKVWKIVW